MNDLATLKSLTNIKPIATLGNACRYTASFDQFFLEREGVLGSMRNGIILTVADDAHEDVEEWLDLIEVPLHVTNRAVVCRTITDNDLQSFTLQLPASRLRNLNHAQMLSAEFAIFKFVTARWQGQEYRIPELHDYFSKLRNAYALSDEAGVMAVTLTLGSVNHTYTSREQMEEVLYPMAYTFFRDDTEL